jgi:hypothetical protein
MLLAPIITEESSSLKSKAASHLARQYVQFSPRRREGDIIYVQAKNRQKKKKASAQNNIDTKSDKVNLTS